MREPLEQLRAVLREYRVDPPVGTPHTLREELAEIERQLPPESSPGSRAVEEARNARSER